jgi:hypothetical protein
MKLQVAVRGRAIFHGSIGSFEDQEREKTVLKSYELSGKIKASQDIFS